MSERTVYAIASGKGGVGKTTTAINLGAMLADRGHEVVVVDTDLGMANLADFLEFEIRSPTLHDVLAGDADADDALHRAPGDIDVLPSAPDIEAFARSDPANLDAVVDDLRETYDYVLLDTGAGVSYDVLVPLALADGVLLVATPDVASVRDTAKTGELAARVESDVVGAVLAQRSSDILNAGDVEETLGTDVLAVVPQDEAVPMGIDAGRPLAAFAPNAPAGQAYRDLAAVLTGETDPDPELDLDDGDVDVGFDAEPPRRTDDSETDVPASERMAESVRDAVGGDDSEGLLGGELASVAEEIRDGSADGAAVDSAGASVEPAGASAESGHGREESGEATDAGGSVETTDESEARSVDDLIDEHMGDDQLAGGGSFGDDDPLAGLDDDRSDADDESGPDADAGSPEGTEGDDGPGAATDAGRADLERATPDSDPLEGNGGDSGSPAFETESSVESGGEESGGVDSRDGEFEDAPFGSGESGEPATNPGGANSDRGDVGDVDSRGVESGDVEAKDVKSGRLSDDEDDDSSGVLGRLGSLFN